MLTHPFLLSLRSPQVVEELTCRAPQIFVLCSPGVEYTGALVQVTEASDRNKCFHALSLGQGQDPIAETEIEEGVRSGKTPTSCSSVPDVF